MGFGNSRSPESKLGKVLAVITVALIAGPIFLPDTQEVFYAHAALVRNMRVGKGAWMMEKGDGSWHARLNKRRVPAAVS